MTETRWLDFAGFFNQCSYGLEHRACPFLKLRQLDQFQKLEYLMQINEKKAVRMIDCCTKYKNNCKKPQKKLSLKSLEVELIAESII